MADDGMLLNLNLKDTALKPRSTIKGGRWRDRIRAQRTRQNPAPSSKAKFGHDLSRHDTETEPVRPLKRQRLNDVTKLSSYQVGNSHTEAAGSPTLAARHKPDLSGGPRQLTSRLFSSNPTPKTVFTEELSETKNGPLAEPSNAPLLEAEANFQALGLARRLTTLLTEKLRLTAPTQIQKKAIPSLLETDNDAFIQSQTGSGKTLAYLLPLIQRILSLSSSGNQVHRDSGLFAIILAPTRELCLQIEAVATVLLACIPWLVCTKVIGGESKKSEKARIRKGVNILIATPGRLGDHLIHTKALDVSTVRWLILDEGDRLMEMGFEDELKTIIGKIRSQELEAFSKTKVSLESLPNRRVTVLCSATMKMNVQKLGDISLEDAIHITGQGSKAELSDPSVVDDVFSAPSQLKQSYVIVPAKLRLVTLISLLRSSFLRRGSVMKVIVFMSCADSVNFHFEVLRTPRGVTGEQAETTPATPPPLTADTASNATYVTSTANVVVGIYRLHGSLSQPVRKATLAAFTQSKDPAVLITTDISSRGLDIPSVDLVVEYDPAFSAAEHLHRVGRTARAGRPGKAVLFLLPGCEEEYITFLKPSVTSTTQLYDTLLSKGLSTSPLQFPVETDAQPPIGHSHIAAAESLQLHLEQRLLASNALLDQGRQAFKSHIRAYATHVRDERKYFDITQLHLGHLAKSYGLREAPTGIGSGSIQRKVSKKAQFLGKENDSRTETEIDTSRRMATKVKAAFNAASEFNIG
jgi:ATP-dependent RNA helicase DDX31/DBP7